MKTKLLTLALLIACSFGSFAQDKKELQTATQKMINIYSMGDYYKLLDLMYPKIFGVISKEEMLASMEKKMKGDDYIVGMVRMDPSTDFGSILPINGGGYYCLITYNIQLKVALNEKVAAKDQEAMMERFKTLLKVEEVNYDEQNGILYAKKRVQAIAIADEASNNAWTFVPLDGSKYVNEVLHEDIRNTIAEQ